MTQKTALQELIEYTDSMVKPGHLHNESLLKIIYKAKSLLPTEMEHINQAFKDGTQDDAIYYLIKDYFTDNFQE